MDIDTEKSYPTPYANSAILPLLLLSLASQKHSPMTAKSIYSKYDYIIVGGGTAGSVVASRLSEIPCINVLLIEAGKDPPLLTEIPALSRFFRFTDIDWGYKTVPQKHTGGSLLNREVPLARGKSVGGSSVLNSAIFIRGSRLDYDGWRTKGAEGWGYEDVLPYFMKLEDNKDPEYVKNGFHGVGGMQTIHRPRYQPEMKKPLFQAARNMGFKVVDPNALNQTGFYDFQAAMRSGQRCSTAKAYLVPAENRTNLNILKDAMVTKVIIKGGNAVGVSYDYQGETYEVFARREVVLSAGAINTAQLLMLSGVGPKKELEKFKIPVLADLPVGKNLQDHCGVPLNFVMNTSILSILKKLANPTNVELYIKTRSGILSSADFTTAVGIVNTHEIFKNDSASYQIRIFEESSIFPKFQYGLKPEVYSQVFGRYENLTYFSCLSQPLHPRSHGIVKLRSSSPYDTPLVDPNYMENPKDVRDIVEGLKTCKNLATAPALKKLGISIFRSFYPGCEQYGRNEEIYFWCLANQIALSTNNPVGTTKMGNPLDTTTVVDTELRVKHLRGLRVVDASIMPTIISGDTHFPTIMIAEKASDIIKSSIECYDDVPENEVQESMSILSVSPMGNFRYQQNPAKRRIDVYSSLEQLKEVLNLYTQSTKMPLVSSSNNIELQMKELVKLIQESSSYRRQEDPTTAVVGEIMRCLEKIIQQIQRSTQTVSNVVYANRDQNAIDQLSLVLNNLRQNNNQNLDSNDEISSILMQVTTLLKSLNGDKDVSESNSRNSVALSNGAMTDNGNALNQILSGISRLREERKMQTLNSNTANGENNLSQLLSSIRGIIPPPQTAENLQDGVPSNAGNVQELVTQIWTTVNEIRQIENLTRIAQNANNNGDRTQEMMEEILSALSEIRNATNTNEGIRTITTSTENPQNIVLNQILSTLDEIKQNNRASNRFENSKISYKNENTKDSVLKDIFSAIEEMKGDITSKKNSTASNLDIDNQSDNLIDLQNQNILLQQILNNQMKDNTPRAETEIMPQTPVDAQMNTPNSMVMPGQQPLINGMPLLPPGIPQNSVLNVLQRQRNLQMLSTLIGANPQAILSQLVGLPPQLMGFPPQLMGVPRQLMGVPRQLMGMPPQLMGVPPGPLPNRYGLPSPPAMMNRFSGVSPNQMPCQNAIILNNPNPCNRNNKKLYSQGELELCQSLHSAMTCQNKSNCRRIQPYLYNYYCGKN